MSTATLSPFLEIIPKIPPGARLIMADVPWEEYEQLLENLGDGHAAKVFYDQGVIEIMTLSSRHEKAKEIMNTLVKLIRDELEIVIESVGSTTIHEQLRGGGAEPDESFYVGEVSHVLGYRDLDFSQDPPPDLVVEIDLTSGSMNKLPIYRRFGVKEIWQAVKFKVHIKILTDDGYEEMSASRLFPFLTAEVLTCFLDLGMEKGESYAARAFRAWLRENAPKAE